MTQEIKTKSKTLSKDTKTAIKNFVTLVESAALLTVAIYSGIQAQAHGFKGLYAILGFAAVLIGLRGAEQFLKHLANK